jgi:microcin C transport system substrate-binding protein
MKKFAPAQVRIIICASQSLAVTRIDRLSERRVRMSNINTITRRETLGLGAAALTFALTPTAAAVESSARHGLSTFDDLKYPADFRQLDYVNTNAPKGGLFSHVAPTAVFNQNPLTFNSLNAFILKGDAAQGMELTFASLMMRAYDEPDAVYGLAARAVQISQDRLSYLFLMRPGITFHDGSPLTAHDVAFSLA